MMGPIYIPKAGPEPGENDLMDRLYAAALVHALQSAQTGMSAYDDSPVPAEKFRQTLDMLLNRNLQPPI